MKNSCRFPCLAVSVGFVLLLTAAEAFATNYPFGQQNPSTSGFTNANSGPWVLGHRFHVNSANVSVTHLGCNTPNGGARDVRLWTTSGTQLAQASVPAGSGWQFTALTTAVSLTQGSDYIVTEHSSSLYDYWLLNNGSIAGWTGDANITYVQSEFVSSSTHIFTTGTSGTLVIYGIAEIGYSIGPPAPGSISVPGNSSTGNYTVSWGASTGATSYDLEEAANSGFTGATNIYNGTGTSHNVSGKANGSYWYRVRANNASGSSAWTSGGPCVVLLPPAAPASVSVPSQSATGSYTVSWSSSATATSYQVQEANNSSFTGAVQVYTGANLSYPVTGKTTGTWYYQVRATNASGSSGYTPGGNGCQIVPPAAPTISVPTSSATGNYPVTWSSSTGATSYDLEEDTSSSFLNPVNVYTGANLSYPVTGKTSGTYWYRVRATGVAGSSAWTPSANGCQIVPPAAPLTITVPPTSPTGIYTVVWSSSTGATSYDLEEDTSSSFSNPTNAYTGANTTFPVSGKSSGTYWYRVRATNGAGSSVWTPSANGCQIVPPAAPVPLTVPASSSTGTYGVSWGSASGAVTYELEEDTTSAFSAPTRVSSAASTSWTAVGKANGTYYYRVRSVNGAGQSGWTTDTVGCLVSLVAPGAPASVTVPVSSSTGSYGVSWSAATGANRYEVEEATDAGFATAASVYVGGLTALPVSGKANGTYWYRVRAGNAAGWSGWTAGLNGCTVGLALPAAPASITVPATSSTGNYAVTWTAGTGALRYELEESQDAGFAGATQAYRGPSLSYTAVGRAAGTYWYRVRAENATGSSAWTPGANGCVVSLTSPGLAVQAGPGNPGPSAERPGASGVRMLHLQLTAGAAEGVRVQSLTIHATGSGDDAAELGTVALWRDVDGNGFADAGEPSAGTGTFTADEGTVTFTLTSEPAIAAGTTAWYLAAVDVRPAAMPGSAFSFSLTPTADVSATGASTSSAAEVSGAGVSGGVKTVATSGAGSLSLSLGPNGPPAGQVAAPASGVPVLQVSLAASSLEGVSVSRVRVGSSGTGDESRGVVARLYLDVNEDGAISASDLPLGTAVPILTDDGTAVFGSLSLTVPAGTRATLLVAFDFGGDRSAGTYGAEIGANADVEAAGSISGLGIMPTGAPVSGSMKEVVSPGVFEPAYFMGGCGGPVGPAGWSAWLLLAAGLAALRSLRRR
jgi:hypothetical protein